jgi:O-antigen ligase
MKSLRFLPLMAILFVVVLPNSEALKNLFWIIILLCLPKVLRLRSAFGRQMTIFEGLLLSISAVALMSAIQSDYPRLAWKGVVDSLLFVSISWYFHVVFAHNGNLKAWLIKALFWATLFGLFLGLRDHLAGISPHIELRSVGIVTHSAIFVGITVLAMYAYLVFDKSLSTTRSLGFVEASGLLIACGMFFLMGSRGAILGFFVAALLLTLKCISSLPRDFRPLKHLVIAAMLAAPTLLIPDVAGHSRVWKKSSQLFFEAEINVGDRHRFALWSLASAAFIRNDSKLFGMGPRTFGQINAAEYNDLALPLNPGEKLGHAHNLFLNKLVEEGILGFLTMFGFFFLALKRSMKGEATPEKIGVLGALTVSIVAGFFNTPFIQEQAVLCGILVGLMMSGEFCKVAETKEK